MEFRELSSDPTNTNTSSSESETNPCKKKRKFHESVDLQFKNPLPLDWEQCLDLESGEMCYLNRKTAKKARSWPEEKKLDLELNISCSDQSDKSIGKCGSFGDSMVALACLNCHLLVMLSKSSPSCPNCKHLHSLPDPPPRTSGGVKPLSTLSLLN